MRSNTRKWLVLAPLVLAILVVALDATIVSVALPTLAGALHASTSQLQWFVTAYTLVFAAALVPGGMLGDRYGRKKVLLAALVLFGAGSLVCALSISAGMFIGARAMLGLGGALIFPVTIGVVPVLFDEGERRKAVAVTMVATLLGFPIGPIAGGWLLAHVSWSWVFLVNLPVVAVALVAVAALMPETRAPQKPRLDAAGVVASSTGLAVLTYGVIETGRRGWGSPVAIGAIIGGVFVLTAFCLWERRANDPLFDLRLFRSRGFSWGTLLATLVSFAMFGLLFAVPQYFEAVRGTNAEGAGLGLLPMIGGLLVGAVAADRLAGNAGARVAAGLGFAVSAAGLLVGTVTRAGSGLTLTIVWTAVFGLGLGFSMPSTMDAALGSLSPDRSAVGSGMIQALRMVGSNFGAAILGSVLNAGYTSHLDLAGLPSTAQTAKQSVEAGVATAAQLHSQQLLNSVRAAFVHGIDRVLLVCGVMTAVGVVLAVVFLPRRALVGETARSFESATISEDVG